MSKLWNHLTQFEPTWTYSTNATAFYMYRDRSRLYHFLMDFSPDYEHTQAFLLHCHRLPTVGQALAELRFEETHKKTIIYHQHSHPILSIPSWTSLPPPSQLIQSTPTGSNTAPYHTSNSQKKYYNFCRCDTHSYEDCRSCHKPR